MTSRQNIALLCIHVILLCFAFYGSSIVIYKLNLDSKAAVLSFHRHLNVVNTRGNKCRRRKTSENRRKSSRQSNWFCVSVSNQDREQEAASCPKSANKHLTPSDTSCLRTCLTKMLVPSPSPNCS